MRCSSRWQARGGVEKLAIRSRSKNTTGGFHSSRGALPDLSGVSRRRDSRWGRDVTRRGALHAESGRQPIWRPRSSKVGWRSEARGCSKTRSFGPVLTAHSFEDESRCHLRLANATKIRPRRRCLDQ